ncbi:hypothetical protein [Entomomonas asaccharolytica]|uniref:Uncharacterized protein n=1 Tax=Entomomonas asaccharolytica TaxID=2785331 RepID=A0A974NED6_9GAMM|nr:hypothetical protein [Entomomonas asaccharolytica]QQP85075.1 hypothetical protein JHT90_11865 [Entomomonas asaccharolytica]
MDDLYQTLGSYDPYSLRIKINKTYREPSERGLGIDSFNKRDCATLFHEFIHQLQNTSSIVGFQQFNAMVSIWHNTRNIIYDPNDKESHTHRNEAIKILKYYQYYNNDKPQKNGLLKITSIGGVQEIAEQKFTNNPIKINYCFNDSKFELNFGIEEFYESCADALERFFCTRIKLDITPEFESDSIPYKIGESIAKKIHPECSDYRLIVFMLTALQHSSPHQCFVYLVNLYGNDQFTDEQIRGLCEKHTKELIEGNVTWIEDTKNILEIGFPLPDPCLGDVVKTFNNSINNNLNKRKVTPFVELDFLERIDENNFKEEIKLLIESFGGCIIYAIDQSGNLPPKPDKIVIGDSESNYHNNHKGWLTFIVSIYLAIKNKIEINYDGNYECPAILYCDHEYKSNNLAFCKKTPHKHPEASGNRDNCAHQLAKYKALNFPTQT